MLGLLTSRRISYTSTIRNRWSRHISNPKIITPALGSRVVQDKSGCILFGQPPEVLKGLMLNKVTSFDTLVLLDVREKDGSLLNNLEFPVYFFLFFSNGLKEGRKLNLVGEQRDINHALTLMRYTLMGPTPDELEEWGTVPELRKEWLGVANAIYNALKLEHG